MAKRIEMNIKESEGYEILYPNTLDSIVSVENLVKEILSLPEDSMLDDVLLKMVVSEGKYVFLIKVMLDGTPLANCPINGISDYYGNPAFTNQNGEFLGVSDSSQVTLSINKYIDLMNFQQSYSAGEEFINLINITLSQKSDNEIVLQSGKTFQFSPKVKKVDFCGCGGGGSGILTIRMYLKVTS